MTQTKTGRVTLHALVDTLPEAELEAATLLLEHLHGRKVDPLLLALYSAPWDDEPLTDEEIAAIEEGREDIRHGRTVPMEEITREFGS